ncbi:hypothetical protein [Parasitella parasitica]|uniref:VPS37 C-terminal domain-containing protein n=1 Tax=Parasitella parasitica TaxID=35722 RepID=A0A0B7NP49_9FUNG|nr:hypothetical protein [Parasitella parasitica]
MSKELKQQQINGLLQQNPSTVTVVDGQIYEVPLQAQENTFLLINLPGHFPDEPPVITISPTGMRHPWIEGDVIMHDALPSWTQQSNLGVLVKDICEEFKNRPPAKKSDQKEDGYSVRPPPPIPSTSTSSAQPMNPEYIAISKLRQVFPFDIFFHSLARVKNLRTFQEELLSGNEQLAHKNLSKEDQLLKLRSEIENLHGQFKLDKIEFDTKEKLQHEAYSRFSSSTVLTRLKASVYESDELSESVAQSFLDGNLDNDSFVKQFREFRKVYHLRASKMQLSCNPPDWNMPQVWMILFAIMRIILAESGHEFESNNSFSKSKSPEEYVCLEQLRKEVENEFRINVPDQILLTVNGIQIKDNTLEPEQNASTIILFNRRLLQDPSLVKLPDCNLITNDMIPTFAELEAMIYTCETEIEKEEEIRIMLKDIGQTILDTCQRRKASIDKLARETNGQAIALEAALANLESHVKTAYQNFGKFDRIAQREFSKHTTVLEQMKNDLQILVSTSIHPRILAQIENPQSATLDTFIPVDLMDEQQKQYTALQKQYHDLAQATMEQRNKVDYLTQQTARVGSTNRTAFELGVAKVEKLVLDSAQAIHGLSGCQKKMASKQSGRIRNAFKSMYRHQQVLCDSEKIIQQERQLALQGFVNCILHISKVEESVAHIYPTLAELEKQMKELRLNIEKKTSDNLTKRLILGYGLLLIEIWRRDKYSDIVTKNACLLSELFSHFGKREERYRQHFNQQVQYLTKQNKTLGQEAILLPFAMQDINESPVICSTSTSIYLSDSFGSFITKNQIESFIQSIHYYQDITCQLRRRLDRESKRLNKGLALLGLPSGPDNSANQKIFTSIPLSPSTSSTTDHTINMKLATPPVTANGSIFQHQKDWELEKASILRQSQEYQNYIEDIHTKHENDRIKFEKDKQSLLRELYSKDKKIEEIKALYELKIEHLEKRQQEAENTFKDQIKQLQDQHYHALETEQITYKRRLDNFYQRINDKDVEINQLEQSLRETKSAPTSPTLYSFGMTVSQDKYDRDISRLQQIINQLKKEPSADITHQLHSRNEEIEGYKSTIAALEVSVKEANAKVTQMTKSEARLKQLALAENTQMMMHAEARVENLTAEHKQNMIELADEYKNEKQVLQIKHQTELDQVKQDMLDRQQTLQEEVETRVDQEKQSCIAKLSELESSWQEKIKLAEQKYEYEIDLHKQQNAKLLKEFGQFKRTANADQRELVNLQKKYKSAKNMAKELVSISSSCQQQQNHSDDVPLIDLLRRTLGNITSLQTKNSMLEQSMDSPYTMSTSYGYY